MKKLNSIGVIDDDPITVFGIKKMLNSLDLSDTIKTYANGKEAIDDIRNMLTNGESIPEVIFLDINMPSMDGWQFLEEFISLPLDYKVRINILTSSIDPADRQNWEFYKEKTHHLIDYKNKPIRRAEIEAITTPA